ncbi:DUF6804 family protein [Pedobacter polaris]|uniref:DUF6804 family protein n=1 Tax=Pedobacter polaris TaxID=2571273 RepID=UPI00268E29E8
MSKEYYRFSIPLNLICLVVLACLLTLKLKYSYYFILKIPLLIGLINLFMLNWVSKRKLIGLIFCVIACFFLPVIKYPFKKQEWIMIDIFAISIISIILLFHIYDIWKYKLNLFKKDD